MGAPFDVAAGDYFNSMKMPGNRRPQLTLIGGCRVRKARALPTRSRATGDDAWATRRRVAHTTALETAPCRCRRRSSSAGAASRRACRNGCTACVPAARCSSFPRRSARSAPQASAAPCDGSRGPRNRARPRMSAGQDRRASARDRAAISGGSALLLRGQARGRACRQHVMGILSYQ